MSPSSASPAVLSFLSKQVGLRLLFFHSLSYILRALIEGPRLYVAFLGVPGCPIGMLPAFHAIVPFLRRCFRSLWGVLAFVRFCEASQVSACMYVLFSRGGVRCGMLVVALFGILVSSFAHDALFLFFFCVPTS